MEWGNLRQYSYYRIRTSSSSFTTSYNAKTNINVEYDEPKVRPMAKKIATWK